MVVGGDGLWNCHIHTDDIGAAIEASLDAGRPRTIRVTDLLDLVEEERWVREGASTEGSGPSVTPLGRAPTTGVVAVASGDGVGQDLPIPRCAGPHRRRAVDESVDRRTGGSGRRPPVRSGDHPPQQRQHPSGGRADQRSDHQAGVGGSHRNRHRGVRRSSGLRPRSRWGGKCRDDGRICSQGGARRGHPCRAGFGQPGRSDHRRRLARAVPPGDRGGGRLVGRSGVRAPAGDRSSTTTTWSPSSRERTRGRRTPGESPSGSTIRGRASRQRCITEVSPCIRICSPSSERTGTRAATADRSDPDASWVSWRNCRCLC